jgi:hypothetical protein
MLLSRPFAQRRITLLVLAGALVLCTFFVLPQGQAFAGALLHLFRGQTIQAVPTDYNHLRAVYGALEQLEHLGKLQGKIPTQLTSVGSIAAAQQLAGFKLAQPSSYPSGIGHTPSKVEAVGPSEVILTLDKATADAYFKKIGSSQTMPAAYDGVQLIVDFPGVAVVEYRGSQGGRLFVGQAGQLVVDVATNSGGQGQQTGNQQSNGNNGNSVTADQLYAYLLGASGLSADTAAALKNIKNWQTTIPLGIPTDRAGWSATSVGGSYSGTGVMLKDNTGIGSAVVWQARNGTLSLGVAGWGLKSSEVQSVADTVQ